MTSAGPRVVRCPCPRSPWARRIPAGGPPGTAGNSLWRRHRVALARAPFGNRARPTISATAVIRMSPHVTGVRRSVAAAVALRAPRTADSLPGPVRGALDQVPSQPGAGRRRGGRGVGAGRCGRPRPGSRDVLEAVRDQLPLIPGPSHIEPSTEGGFQHGRGRRRLTGRCVSRCRRKPGDVSAPLTSKAAAPVGSVGVARAT